MQTRFAIWRIWQLLTVRMQTWIRGGGLLERWEDWKRV